MKNRCAVASGRTFTWMWSIIIIMSLFSGPLAGVYAQDRTAPANIFFLIDDSGSMASEFFIDDQSPDLGRFDGEINYLYQNEDNFYSQASC